uniref:Uncharacterized protein n=1 Tax=Triticum urartu TaxID=4572 RepID=A0A8R7V1L4_TRIUA
MVHEDELPGQEDLHTLLGDAKLSCRSSILILETDSWCCCRSSTLILDVDSSFTLLITIC